MFRKKVSMVLVLAVLFGLAAVSGAFAQQKEPPRRSVVFADLLNKQTKINWNSRKNIVKRQLKNGSFFIAEIIEFKIPLSGPKMPEIAEVSRISSSGSKSLYSNKAGDKVGDKVTLDKISTLPHVLEYTITVPSEGLEVLCCTDVKEFAQLGWYYFRIKPGVKIEFKPPNKEAIAKGAYGPGGGSIKFLGNTEVEFDLGFETEVATREFMYGLASAPNRDQIRKNVDATKKAFSALKDKTKCIDSVGAGGCGCKGDVLTHIINTQTADVAANSAILELIPYHLATEFNKEAGICTAKSQLAYHIACYYGHYPTFDQYYRQCYILFGDVERPYDLGLPLKMSQGALEDFFTENVPKILLKLAPGGLSSLAKGVPLVGTAIKVVISSTSDRREVQAFGREAAARYASMRK